MFGPDSMGHGTPPGSGFVVFAFFGIDSLLPGSTQEEFAGFTSTKNTFLWIF